MNGHTAKLLKKWARHTGESIKEVKRHWLTLNADDRARERKTIVEGLGKDDK